MIRHPVVRAVFRDWADVAIILGVVIVAIVASCGCAPGSSRPAIIAGELVADEAARRCVTRYAAVETEEQLAVADLACGPAVQSYSVAAALGSLGALTARMVDDPRAWASHVLAFHARGCRVSGVVEEVAAAREAAARRVR